MASEAKRVSSPPMTGQPVTRKTMPTQPPGNQSTGLPIKGIMKKWLSSGVPSSSIAPTKTLQDHNLTQQISNPSHQHSNSSQQHNHSSHQENHLMQQNVQQGNQPPHHKNHSLQGSHQIQQSGYHSQQGVQLSHQGSHHSQQPVHPSKQGGHLIQQINNPSQQENHPNQSHPTSQSGPSHSTSHMQPSSLPNLSHPNMHQSSYQHLQRPPQQSQVPSQQHQGLQRPPYQRSALQNHQYQGSTSHHPVPPQLAHPGVFKSSVHDGIEQGPARGTLHKGKIHAKHILIPSSVYPVNSHHGPFGPLFSHPIKHTGHTTHSNPPVVTHPNHPKPPLRIHPTIDPNPTHPPHPTPPPYQQPPPPSVSNNETKAIEEPPNTLPTASQNELLQRLHSTKSDAKQFKNISKKVKDSMNEVQNSKDLNTRLLEDNEELRDLCCFLDDDRQKGRKMAREWQRFGRYTASVMRQEVSNYQEKLKQLEVKQQQLIKENLELKELCLFLDEERSVGGLCTNCGGNCSVVPVSRLQAIRDEGDGSSSDELEASSGMLTEGLASPGGLKMLKLNLSNEVIKYIRNLEERITQMEGGGDFVENKIDDIVNNFKDNSNPNRIAAVTNAMKVMEVHNHVLEKSLESDDTQDQLGDGEKSLVREMCNVVWRKLEEG